jgi:hypothetical protein
MSISFFKTLGPVIEREVDFISRRLNLTSDEVYNLINTEAERNQAEWYSNTVPNLNYVDPSCRLAYLYIVAAANAGTFLHVLEDNDDLKRFILDRAEKQGQLKVCSFGAGPGTELLALAKFFHDNPVGHCVSVDFLLLDKVQEWMSSWNGIRDQVNDAYRELYGPARLTWPMIPSGNFMGCDVTNVSKLHDYGNVWQQDIYVINFLLSEIFKDEPGLRAFLSEVAASAPAGARFVFIERYGPMWRNQMVKIAMESKITLSQFKTSRDGRLADENPADLGYIFETLQDRRKPRTSWNVVYSIGVKQ